MAAVTLATLRARVREAADMTGSAFIADTATSLDAWINAALQELHELVTKASPDEWVTSSAIATVVNSSLVALPGDVLRLLNVALPYHGRSLTLKKFPLQERSAYEARTNASGLPRYRREKDNLRLYPAPNSVMAGTLLYVPQLQVTAGAMKSTATVALTGTAAVVVPVGSVIATTAGDRFRTLAAGTLAAATSYAGLAAGAAVLLGARYWVDDGGTLRVYQCSQAGNVGDPKVPPTGVTTGQVDGTAKWDFLGLGNGAVDVAVESEEHGAVAAAARAITTIKSPLSGFLGVMNVAACTAGVAGYTTNLLVNSGDYVDFDDGWEEFAVAKAAIRCAAKEESDTSALTAISADVERRIRAAAPERDEGEPDQMVDTDSPYRGSDPRYVE